MFSVVALTNNSLFNMHVDLCAQQYFIYYHIIAYVNITIIMINDILVRHVLTGVGHLQIIVNHNDVCGSFLYLHDTIVDQILLCK